MGVTTDKTGTRNSIAGDLSVLACFLIFGLLSGLLFALLVSRSSLQSFFFVKADKFLIPRYSYWFTFSLLQLFGLAGAYLVSVSRQWLEAHTLRERLLPAALIIGLAAPALRFVTPVMNLGLGLNWDFVIAPIAFLVLLSGALCFLSGDLKLLPIAIVWNILFVAAAFAFIYAGVRIMGRSDSYEFVQWPMLEAMLALSFGSWLVWRRRKNSQRPWAANAPVNAHGRIDQSL